MAEYLPTPSPSPPPMAGVVPVPATLSTQINTATRKRHTQLNKLIAERLPLALPPYTTDPKLLYRGLALFSDIYIAFEFAWREITYSDFSDDDAAPRNDHQQEVLRWLAHLRPDGLERTARLTRDLDHLETITGAEHDEAGVPKSDVVEAIRIRPHIAIAYAWVMYMAIFSGGRWIRQQFAEAGSEFWTGQDLGIQSEKEDNASKLQFPGFTFLSFDSEDDGEDTKAEFKRRLAQADTLLTQKEKQDVIETADDLFGLCIELVGELDRRIWWSQVYRFRPSILIIVLVFFALAVLYWFDNYGYLAS